jgi:membrane protease YdiL (CAAX protease family)
MSATKSKPGHLYPTVDEPLDDEHSLGRSVFLHLLPGFAMLAFYAVFSPFVVRLGFPPTFAGSLSILFVLLPLEVGLLLYLGRQRNGRVSLAGIVGYRERLPMWQYLVFVPLLVFWYFMASSWWRSVEHALAGPFSWVTNIVPSDNPNVHYPATIFLIAAIAQILTSGVIAPIVEELYFRGHLLPRLGKFGLWAPMIGATLFSFQHVWTPLEDPGRIIAWLPVVYLVWRKRSIYPGIVFHLVTNMTAVLATAIYLYGLT